MKRTMSLIAGLVVAAVTATGPAAAQGLADLHDQRAEGGRWCMQGHFHSGSSSGQPTRAAAEKAAIDNWAGFTAWEYGNNWASWRIAASRSVSCSQSGGWGCQIEARPCRPLVGAGTRRAKSK